MAEINIKERTLEEKVKYLITEYALLKLKLNNALEKGAAVAFHNVYHDTINTRIKNICDVLAMDLNGNTSPRLDNLDPSPPSKSELPKLNVPYKYLPYENVSLDRNKKEKKCKHDYQFEVQYVWTIVRLKCNLCGDTRYFNNDSINTLKRLLNP